MQLTNESCYYGQLFYNTMTIDEEKGSFRSYLVSNKKLIRLASIVSVLFFLFLKIFFPYPDLYSDSLNYVLWAKDDFTVAYRPMGYSHFLQLVHAFSHGYNAITCIQYLLFFVTTTYLLLSADHLIGLPGKFRGILMVVSLANPLLLFQTNMISSDSLFCSLTVLWFTLCLWVLKKGTLWALVAQAFVLYLCIEVRYTALFYPLIAAVAFVASYTKLIYKISGITLTASIVFFAIEQQKDKTEQVLQVRMFSGFAGWQVANNALYCYKHIKIDNNDLPNVRTQFINRMVEQYIDSMGSHDEVGSDFIWARRSPLKLCCVVLSKKSKIDYFLAWFVTSEELNNYGWYIIKKFPFAFARYFIWPNTKKYFYPDKEAMSDYNCEQSVLPDDMKVWLGMDVNKPVCRIPHMQQYIIMLMPAVSGILNLLAIFVLLITGADHVSKRKQTARDSLFFIMWSIFYVTFMAFTIFAAAVNLRFMDAMFVLAPVATIILWQQRKFNERKTSQ